MATEVDLSNPATLVANCLSQSYDTIGSECTHPPPHALNAR